MCKVELEKRCNCGKVLKLSWWNKLKLIFKDESYLSCNNCLCKYKIKKVSHIVIDNVDNDYDVINKVLKHKRENPYRWFK